MADASRLKKSSANFFIVVLNLSLSLILLIINTHASNYSYIWSTSYKLYDYFGTLAVVLYVKHRRSLPIGYEIDIQRYLTNFILHYFMTFTIYCSL